MKRRIGITIARLSRRLDRGGLAAEGIVTDWEPKQVKLRFERKDGLP